MEENQRFNLEVTPETVFFIRIFFLLSFSHISFCRKQVKIIPARNYMFKVNNRNTRTRCEICSKLTIKTLERRVLVSLLLTLNIFQTLFYSFCVSFEQVIVGWDNLYRSIHLSCSSKRCSQACNFIKKTPQHRCFPVNFMKCLRTPFMQNTSRLMLLYLAIKQKTMQVVV